jgi:glycosyltransferase involved in cell wall biosynthesis
MHALMQARGVAVISLASDLQDPPELIPQFVRKWEEGFRIVAGVKPKSRETPLMFMVRRLYYRTIGRISEIRLIENFTGFGLYDRSVIDVVREMDDPYPYFRGMIADIGFAHAEVPYVQPRRVRGITKNNFYTLYDMAMLGITSHSKLPIRSATMGGFALSALSLLASFGYLIYKLLHWDSVSFGMAPILIGFFFFASVQLFFIGILGEYIAAIHTQVLKRPLVVERERVNFEEPG